VDKITMFSPYPCLFVEIGAGDSDISHCHVVHRLLCFGNTSLLLQTEQYYKRTHDPASQLQKLKTFRVLEDYQHL